mgnify:CR=1 FL=1
MAKGIDCPNTECSERFVWDWCQDIWETVSGQHNCRESILMDNKDREVTMYTCPSCDSILAFLICDKLTEKSGDEYYFFPNDEWENADWEEHAAEE